MALSGRQPDLAFSNIRRSHSQGELPGEKATNAQVWRQEGLRRAPGTERGQERTWWGAGPGEPFKKGNVLETAMLSCRQVLQLGVDMLQDEWLLWVGRGRVETRHQSGDP